MDPLSLVASVISLTDFALRTTSAIVKYAESTRNATTDRKLLAEEASSLYKVLERFRARAKADKVDASWLRLHVDLLRQFQTALDELARVLKLEATTNDLEKETRLKAALTTARWSFTKSEVYAILERLSRLHQYANTMLLEEQNATVDRIVEMQQEETNARLRTQMINWISPLHMSQMQRIILERTERGSGKWFLESAQFINWLNATHTSSQRLVWCYGMPGAGKTVLASLIVDYMQRWRLEAKAGVKTAVAVLYLRYNDLKQTLDNLLGSLIKQLLQELDLMPQVIQDLYQRHFAHDTTPSFEEILVALRATLRAFERSYLIVDGLDECSEDVRWDLEEHLQGLDAHILITSRSIDAIGEELSAFERMEIRAHEEDLELFIDQQIRKNRNLRKLIQKSPSVRQDIKQTVVMIADGMFLLAKLHIESLSAAAALSVRRVRNKLSALPSTLDESYDAAMQRIRDQDEEYRSIAWKALSWIIYAYRSLSVGELQHALMIEAGDDQLDEEAAMDGQAITACCAGLVVIDQVSNTVSLVHYTAKRYLEAVSQNLFPGFHGVITMSCATYLTLNALRDATLHEIVSNFPLACYAAQYIGDHAREHPEDSLESSVLVVICDLLSSPRKRKPLLSLLNSLDLIRTGIYSASDQALQLEDDVLGPDAAMTLDQTPGTDGAVAELTQDLSALSSTDGLTSEASMSASIAAANQLKLDSTQSRFPEVTALHLAASMGLAKVASMLLRNASDIDAVDGTGKTALAIAMERGMQSAVSLLIENGASVSLDSAHGQRVFLLTAEREWREVADSIIRKATENGPPNEVRLQIAAFQGDGAEVRRISDMSELVLKTTTVDFGTAALLLAVERGHCEVIAPILAAGVDVNTPDGSGQTVLHRAARRRDIPMLRTLIATGANIDERNDDGWTPLTATTRLQDLELARFLIDAGCSPNTAAHNGLTELYKAATSGETEYVKFLLAIGTNPSIRTRPGWAPLHWSAANGHVEATRLLLEAGADVLVVSDQNVTPLDLAIRAKQTAIIDMLLKYGAKCGEGVLRMPDRNDSLALLHEYSMHPIANGQKLVLMFDEPALTASMRYGQFIYQPEQGGRVYFVSQLLDTTSTDTLTVRLASAPGMPREYASIADGQWPSDRISFADALFEITKVRADHVEYSIRDGMENPNQPATTLVKSWTGDWKAHRLFEGSDKMMFQTVPDWAAEGAKVAAGERTRFVGVHGELLARMNWLSQVPVARIEGGLELEMQHLLVTCWVAMLWAETVGRKGAATAAR